ncbi:MULTISPECIES: InlB B-repeat-containing protein [Faecalibacterium]|uniref:InlB B-repeat-containing protein n=1 Tax=Faecalibacterium TaxID=216851 RepID=UPI0012DEE98A|nr:InlB B-repeat-containing protein [Faecalibacterium prausnitzii]MBO1310888.1 InlB B-repeat-containing protein [Faecalibacterium sp. Marseille-Q4164]
MRKNHHGKKDRLVKRVFALCLALAVICTCLVPVFATEGLSDLQVEKELPGTSEEEAAGFGDDFPAVDDGEPREVYDDSEAAGFGEEEASRPVEGGEDNLDGGPTVTDSEWGTVIDYSTSTSTSTDSSSSTETQWSGEDDVVEKPDDKVVVSGDEIKKLQDMVVYRFWLKELNANDLQDITAQAQINNMTESEYLARNGEVLWNLYFIQAVPRAETIADYSSYIENPSSNRDPKGELRQFDYWYTLDELGNRVRLNLTDPTSNILDDKTTTVNVYAAWKDGTVGSDEEEDVDHEDLVDKNPVPVDLTAKASASYEDEDGNTKSVNLPVEVKNLPSAAHSLSVIHMGDDDMESFYESHSNDFGSMAPILGLKISPKNAKGETVQPANGQKATVTVSGLDALPEIAAMEEVGALTADALKVLHQKDDGTVEKLDVVSYENGTLTFETSSFSPFVIALEYPDQGSEGFDDDGIEIVSIEIDGVEYPNVNDGIATISSIQGDAKVPVGATITLRSKNGKSYYEHKWIITPNKQNPGEAKFVDSNGNLVDEIYGVGDTFKTVRLKVTKTGELTINHRHGDPKADDEHKFSNGDELKITVVESDNPTSSYNLYVYTQIRDYSQSQGDYYKPHVKNKAWNGMAVGTILNVPDPETYKWKERPYNQLYDTNSTENKLGTEILVDSGQFPVIPIKQADGSYKDYYYKEPPSSWESNAVKKNYGGTYTIKWYEVVGVGGANTGKNGTQGDWTGEESLRKKYTSGVYESPITYVGDKIMTYHLDGLLLIHDATHINVQFMVQDAGKNTFDLVNDYGGAYTVQKQGDSIQLNTIARPDVKRDDQTEAVCPETKTTADGTVYTFKGWYTDENCTQKADFVNGTISADTTFYAKYVPASANLTVTKTVTGKLGDTNKAFTFTITKADGTSANITDANVEISEADSAKVEWLRNGKFTLKDGASIIFKNLPSGEYKVIEEDYSGEKYDTSWQIGTDGEVYEKNSTATVTIGTTEQTVHFTNHRTLEPDLGVLLDTLPYIVILAVVAGGVALLMLRKHRKEDD